MSGDSQQVSVVRTPTPGWPTSEQQQVLRAASAPGHTAIYTRDTLPTKFRKKFAMAAEFVRVAKSRTAKVTLLRPCSKCVLMESGQDCLVTFKGLDGLEMHVTMGPQACTVDNITVKRPRQLPAPAQELYSRAAAERERAKEVEAALVRLGSEKNFPAIVGSGRFEH